MIPASRAGTPLCVFPTGATAAPLLASLLFLAACSPSAARFTSSNSHRAKGSQSDTLGAGFSPRASSETATASGNSRADDRDASGIGSAALTPEPRIHPSREDNPRIDRRRVLSSVMGMMGTPYSGGGSDTGGIDCSGFTARVYREAIGSEIPHSCREQFECGAPVARDKLRFGDLVFFDADGRRLSHVGIYVGDGLFAHASVSLGITVSLLESAYYKKSYAGARRLVR